MSHETAKSHAGLSKEEKAAHKSFRDNFLEAATNARRAGEITVPAFVMLWIASLNTKAMTSIEELAAHEVAHDKATGVISTQDVKSIDWVALIQKLLPLILAFLEALRQPTPTV